MAINPLQLGAGLPTSTFELDFSPLTQLGQTIREGQKRATLAELGQQVANGTIDYNQAAGKVIGLGDLASGLSLLQQGQGQKASADFAKNLAPLFGNQPQSPALNVQPQPASTDPRGIRNNNPLNINDGSFTQSQPGYAGSDGRFAKFASADQGLNAASNLIDTYNTKYGLNTVQGIVNRWAPASENGASTNNYVAAVAKQMGVAPDQPLNLSDPATKQKLVGAMAQFENGRPVPGQSAPVQVSGQAAGQTGVTATPATGSPTLGGVQLSRAVPALLQAATNPNLPKAQQETARELLKSALDQSKLPEAQQNYVLYRSQGGTDDFTTWDRKNKQAGATAITNDMRGENAEAAAIGKGAGERANETLKAANAGAKQLASLSRIDALLANVQQGKIEPARMTVSAIAKSMGLNDDVARSIGLKPEDVGSAQALQALTNEAVVGKIGAGGFPANNFSDADRQFLTGTLAQLGNDPEANKIITEAGRRVAQRDIEKAKEWMAFRRDPANKGKSFDDFEIGWADKVAKSDLTGDLRKEADALIAKRQPQGRQGSLSPADTQQSLANARAAIQANPAVRDAVIQRLRGAGIDPSGL